MGFKTKTLLLLLPRKYMSLQRSTGFVRLFDVRTPFSSEAKWRKELPKRRLPMTPRQCYLVSIESLEPWRQGALEILKGWHIVWSLWAKKSGLRANRQRRYEEFCQETFWDTPIAHLAASIGLIISLYLPFKRYQIDEKSFLNNWNRKRSTFSLSVALIQAPKCGELEFTKWAIMPYG